MGCSGSAQKSCKISPVGVSLGSPTDEAPSWSSMDMDGCRMDMEELGPLWPFGVCSSIKSQLGVRCQHGARTTPNSISTHQGQRRRSLWKPRQSRGSAQMVQNPSFVHLHPFLIKRLLPSSDSHPHMKHASLGLIHYTQPGGRPRGAGYFFSPELRHSLLYYSAHFKAAPLTTSNPKLRD